MKNLIWFSKKGKTHYCGIGDGVVDGIYAKGKTKSLAALNLIKTLNKTDIEVKIN